MERTTEVVRRIVESGKSVTWTYEEWTRRAMELASLGEDGRPLFHLLAQMDEEKYNRRENDRKFTYCLRHQRRGGRTIASFFYENANGGGRSALELSALGRSALELSALELSALGRSALGRSALELSALGSAENGSEGLLETRWNEWEGRREAAESAFCRSMVATGTMSRGEMDEAVRLYRLEATAEGAIVFGQRDRQGRLREAHVMHYLPDGHRDHGRPPCPLSWLMKNRWRDRDGRPLLPPGLKSNACLFGLHLTGEHPEAPVAIVESEKTAIICSQWLKAEGFLWLATGGSSGLSVERLRPLQGRRIILFPDTDPKGETFRRWRSVAIEAWERLRLSVGISDVLERMASTEEKERKIDIGDWKNETLRYENDKK